MRSKVFIFLTFFFIAGLVIVGWYFMETYENNAPVAMVRGAGYVENENASVAAQQDFLTWTQSKLLHLSDFISKKTEPLLK